MNSSTIERAAYIAAHRIMQADLTNPQFACPGTRRSKMVDAIAGIIKGVMEAEPEYRPSLYDELDAEMLREGLMK